MHTVEALTRYTKDEAAEILNWKMSNRPSAKDLDAYFRFKSRWQSFRTKSQIYQDSFTSPELSRSSSFLGPQTQMAMDTSSISSIRSSSPDFDRSYPILPEFEDSLDNSVGDNLDEFPGFKKLFQAKSKEVMKASLVDIEFTFPKELNWGGFSSHRNFEIQDRLGDRANLFIFGSLCLKYRQILKKDGWYFAKKIKCKPPRKLEFHPKHLLQSHEFAIENASEIEVISNPKKRKSASPDRNLEKVDVIQAFTFCDQNYTYNRLKREAEELLTTQSREKTRLAFNIEHGLRHGKETWEFNKK